MFDPSGPMGAPGPLELMVQLMAADEAGVKLEVVGNEFTWEFFPSSLHQGMLADMEEDLIRSRIRNPSGCGCHFLSDTYIQFSDGSVKRPDLMVFCQKPPRTRAAITLMPEAVVEVLSPRGERKDLQVGPPFYLLNGIKDVVVVDPDGRQGHHFRRDGYRPLALGATVALECGCELTIPDVP